MPPISGINTSRMIKSGLSPLLIFSIASGPLLRVSTSNPSTSSKVCRYFRILGSSSTTRIFSLTDISVLSVLIQNPVAPIARSARESETYCPFWLHFLPKFFRGVPAPNVLLWPIPAPFPMCFCQRVQNPQRSPGDVPEQSPNRNPKRSLQRCSGAGDGTGAVLVPAQPPQLFAPKNAVSQSKSPYRQMECASVSCPANLPLPAAPFDSQTGKYVCKDRCSHPCESPCAERPPTIFLPSRPDNRVDHFRATVKRASHFPALSNSGTSKRAAPIARSSLLILPECPFVSPSIDQESQSRANRSSP